MGIVQRYELDDQIGVGGMAEIHRARAIAQDGTELPVVIKRIHPRYSDDPEYRAMFHGEAKIAGILDHPNVVRLLDAGEMDGRLFIAMELVDGKDLQTVLRAARDSKRAISTPAALYVTSQVLAALHHAHTRTVSGKPIHLVHRDVTPQNILLSKSGGVKVADFGLAKAAIRPGQTVAGVIKGNIRYMAPEQVTAKTVDARTDLYATGMILHALLSGKHPFEDEPLVKAIQRCITGDIPVPAARADGSQRLIDTVMKSVSTDPAMRYQTAASFLEAVSHLAGHGELAMGRTEIEKLVQHASLPSSLPPSPRAHSIAARLGPLIAEASGDDGAVFRSSARGATNLQPAAAARTPAAIGGHSEVVTALASFPDAVRALSASNDRSARIWSAASRREEKALRGHENAVVSCAVSPSGELVLTGGRDNRARLWEASSGSTIATLDSAAAVTAVAFSNAGDLAFVGTEDAGAMLWDYGRRRPHAMLAGHGDTVSAATFSRDGKRVVTACYDGFTRFFDAQQGTLLGSLESGDETDSVLALHASQDGSLLATANASGVIRIWDMGSGAVARTLVGHRGAVTAVTISPDRERLISSSLDGTIRLWRLADATEVERIDVRAAVGSIAVSPDFRWALVGAERTVAYLPLE